MKIVNEQLIKERKILAALKDNSRIASMGTEDDLGIDIQESIERESALSLVANGIFVTVQDGIVTLEGEVYRDQERMIAGDLTAALAGEDNVNNYLRVVGV